MKATPKAPESRSERYEDMLENARVRAPSVDKVLQNALSDMPVERRLFAAYDALLAYAKAMAMGDECSNPLT